jgi:DNA-binding transcriptional MerR regulator
MQNLKTYYTISEVSKMLNIYEHTIRYWDSKLPDLSNRVSKGKTRFFNLKNIDKISRINELLKHNDSLMLAYEIISKKSYQKSHVNLSDSSLKIQNSQLNLDKINRIKGVSKSLKKLII